MRKIIFNLSDCVYEKLRFESICEKKDIITIISERLLEKPFSEEVIQAYEDYITDEYSRILREE